VGIEITGLCIGVLLGLVHIVLASHSASRQRGYRWTAGARDEVLPPLGGVAGRLERASRNYLETFPFFAALVLAVLTVHATGEMSKWGVVAYLVGRSLYLPLYASGAFLVRSLVWNVATGGIVLLLIALFAR